MMTLCHCILLFVATPRDHNFNAEEAHKHRCDDEERHHAPYVHADLIRQGSFTRALVWPSCHPSK